MEFTWTTTAEKVEFLRKNLSNMTTQDRKNMHKYDNNRPEFIEKRKEYAKRPDVIEKKKEYAKEYAKRPDVIEKAKEYAKRPEVMAKRREYDKERRRFKKEMEKNICDDICSHK
jgi:hypothetical protein